MALALQYSKGPSFCLGIGQAMHLLLINPSNPLVSIVNLGESRWNRYRSGSRSASCLGRPDSPGVGSDDRGREPRRARLLGHATAGPGGDHRVHLAGWAGVRRCGPLSPSGGAGRHGWHPRHHVLDEVSQRVTRSSPEKRKASGPRSSRMRGRSAATPVRRGAGPHRGNAPGATRPASAALRVWRHPDDAWLSLELQLL